MRARPQAPCPAGRGIAGGSLTATSERQSQIAQLSAMDMLTTSIRRKRGQARTQSERSPDVPDNATRQPGCRPCAADWLLLPAQQRCNRTAAQFAESTRDVLFEMLGSPGHDHHLSVCTSRNGSVVSCATVQDASRSTDSNDATMQKPAPLRQGSVRHLHFRHCALSIRTPVSNIFVLPKDKNAAHLYRTFCVQICRQWASWSRPDQTSTT